LAIERAYQEAERAGERKSRVTGVVVEQKLLRFFRAV
jgi:hypothetical protein